MNQLFNLLCLPALAVCLTLQAMEPGKPCTTPKLLFIETGNNPGYAFNNFMGMAQSLGFEPTFKQGYEVDNTTLDQYATIVLNVDHSLFKALTNTRKYASYPPQPFVIVLQNILREIATLKNKQIIFSLPSSAITKNDPDSQAIVEELLAQSNSRIPVKSIPTLTDYITLFKEPDSRKRFMYATTLARVSKKALSPEYEAAQEKFKGVEQSGDMVALPSPMPAEPEALAPLWPHGVTWQDQGNNNRILLTRDSYINFADVSENFLINPLDESLRYELVAVAYRTLQQFLIDRHAPATQIPSALSSTAARAAQLEMQGKRSTRTYAPSHAWLKEKPVSCAWMDVKSFYAKGPESLDAILHSGINVLWLDLIPEIFLAENARCADRKEELLTHVEWFTRNLQERAKVLGKPLPLLFMGTDITLNYRTVPVDVAAVDIYGTKMPKIPSPLNVQGFWKTQVSDVIDSFITAWQSKIGNGLPLSGIFFDFEMYQAPEQASNYTDIMDFSDLAWQTFLDANPQREIPVLDTVPGRVLYLIDTNQMNAYFKALTAEAKRIGTLVRHRIKERLPHAIIATYNANIPSSWWYTGFMSSLSSPEEPLLCATFNSNFFSHAEWLEKHGVYLHHLQVLMLSKLRNRDDFKQIDTILKNHDGIWFNRFSRLAEDPQGNADHIESSPLPADEVARGIGEHLNSKK